MTNPSFTHLTKGEYLSQLANKLRVLPENELADALEYYDGYLNDAEDERAAIAQLGAPGDVAATILANHVEKGFSQSVNTNYGQAGFKEDIREDFKTKKKGFKAAWIAILAIFALPVGLPLLIVAAVVPFALFIALASVIFAVGISSVILIFGGAVSLLVTPLVFIRDIGFGLVTGGTGLMMMGLGLLFIRLVLLMMGGFRAIAKFVSRKILRRSKYDGRIKTI